jgi:hypothetical protein
MQQLSMIQRTLLAAALSCAALGSVQAQTARFDASASSIGFDGVRDEDFVTGATASGALATSLLMQFDNQSNGNGRTGTGRAFVWATPTRLWLSTSAALEAQAERGLGSYGGGVNGWGRASASVPFRIDAAGLAGQAGTIQVPLLLSGVDFVDAGINSVFPGVLRTSAYSLLSVSGDVANPTPGCTAGFQQCHTLSHDGSLVESGAPLASVIVSFPFTFGQWTSFNMQLESGVASSGTAINSSPQSPGLATVSGMAYAEHEVQWGGIQSVWTGGAAVGGWTVTSIPGVNLAPVPEPGSAGLLAAGSLVLAWLGRRRLGSCTQFRRQSGGTGTQRTLQQLAPLHASGFRYGASSACGSWRRPRATQAALKRAPASLVWVRASEKKPSTPALPSAR